MSLKQETIIRSPNIYSSVEVVLLPKRIRKKEYAPVYDKRLTSARLLRPPLPLTFRCRGKHFLHPITAQNVSSRKERKIKEKGPEISFNN